MAIFSAVEAFETKGLTNPNVMSDRIERLSAEDAGDNCSKRRRSFNSGYVGSERRQIANLGGQTTAGTSQCKLKMPPSTRTPCMKAAATSPLTATCVGEVTAIHTVSKNQCR